MMVSENKALFFNLSKKKDQKKLFFMIINNGNFCDRVLQTIAI